MGKSQKGEGDERCAASCESAAADFSQTSFV
jgi:hypothetical protein